MRMVNSYNSKGRIIKFHGVMKPLSNRYVAKSRLYDVSFKGQNISNVNFKGAIITHSSFKNSIISDCEFLGTNLSRCNFTGATIKNCIFLCAKLNQTNFKNATFENVIFVTQNLDGFNKDDLSKNNKILTKIQKFELNEELKQQIDIYHDLSKDRITHILKFSDEKYNYLHISILLETFSPEKLCHALKKLIEKKIFDISTIYSLINTCKIQSDVL